LEKKIDTKFDDLAEQLKGLSIAELEERLTTCVGEECALINEKIEEVKSSQSEFESRVFPEESDDVTGEDEEEFTSCSACGTEFTEQPAFCPGCGVSIDWDSAR